jgi:hypothetical protein
MELDIDRERAGACSVLLLADCCQLPALTDWTRAVHDIDGQTERRVMMLMGVPIVMMI